MVNRRSYELFIVFILVGMFLSGCARTPKAGSQRHLVSQKFGTPFQLPQRIKTIVLDPGHGGSDPGAIGRGGTQEKEITLKVAKQLAPLLAKQGFRVVLTRGKDLFVDLQKRVDVAIKVKGDLFISIHANAVRSRFPIGFEVYYLKDLNQDEEWVKRRSNQWKNDFLNPPVKAIVIDKYYEKLRAQSIRLAKNIEQHVATTFDMKIRGVKPSRFHVLRESKIPSILIELGFISNREEEALLRDSTFQHKMAQVLAKAIGEYCEEKEAKLQEAKKQRKRL